MLNPRSWLWAREAITLSTLEVDDACESGGGNNERRDPVSGPYGAEVRQMGKIYEDFTELRLPRQWIEPDPPEQTRMGESSVCFSISATFLS